MKKNKIISILASVMVMLSLSANAQWDVPAVDADKMAPFEISKDAVSEGKAIYTKNCISCHGGPGEGKNIAAINATDFGTREFQKGKKLGYVYYQMTTGKGAMPSFAGSIPETDRWKLAMFLKTFETGSSFADFAIKCITADLKVTEDDDAKKLSASVSGKMGENHGSLEGVVVKFMVKRRFGNMAFAEVATDASGNAVASFPTDLPGDVDGNVDIIVEFADKEAFGLAKFEKKAKWGTAFVYVNPLDERAMWGTNAKAPLWIMFSYLIGVIGAWIVIIYVVLQMLKLKKAGIKN